MGSGTKGAVASAPAASSPYKAVAAAALYFVTALALTVLNKSIFSMYRFRLVRVLGLGQLVVTVLMQHLLAALGLIQLPTISRETLRSCLPVAGAALGAQLSVFAALGSTNLVMFGTLRRTNIIFTLVAQRLFLNRNASPRVVMACVLVCAGAVLASATDLSFDAYGYGMALLANVFTSAYLVLIKRSPVQLDSIALVYHCAVINAPALALYCVAAGDFEELARFEYLYAPSFQLVFGVSVMLGFCINYATMLNTRVNSPLTQVVTGQTKGAFVLLLGVLLFNPANMSASNLAGAAVGFLGSLVYAVSRYAETNAARAAAKPQTPSRAEENAAVVQVELRRWPTPAAAGGQLAPSEPKLSPLDFRPPTPMAGKAPPRGLAPAAVVMSLSAPVSPSPIAGAPRNSGGGNASAAASRSHSPQSTLAARSGGAAAEVSAPAEEEAGAYAQQAADKAAFAPQVMAVRVVG